MCIRLAPSLRGKTKTAQVVTYVRNIFTERANQVVPSMKIVAKSMDENGIGTLTGHEGVNVDAGQGEVLYFRNQSQD